MVTAMAVSKSVFEDHLRIETEFGAIDGDLVVPERAWGTVIFADGCGAWTPELERPSLPASLQELGLATLSVDLLKSADDHDETSSYRRRFDLRVMAARLHAATDWVLENCDHTDRPLHVGYIGTSLGAAAALRAAAQRSEIPAVVSCGGWPDMAGSELPRVRAATLMIIGERDEQLLDANRTAYDQLVHAYRREVAVIRDSDQYFEENGNIDEVSKLIGQWFVRYLRNGSKITSRFSG